MRDSTATWGRAWRPHAHPLALDRLDTFNFHGEGERFTGQGMIVIDLNGFRRDRRDMSLPFICLNDHPNGRFYAMLLEQFSG